MFVIYENGDRLAELKPFSTMEEAQVAKKIIREYKNCYDTINNNEESILEIREIKTIDELVNCLYDFCIKNKLEMGRDNAKDAVELIQPLINSSSLAYHINHGNEKISIIYTTN